MRSKVILFSMNMILGLESLAQGGIDPVFSQYYSNALYLNPALAGSHYCPRVKLIRRAQWPGVPISYTSSYLSYDQYVFRIESGVGATMSYESLGEGVLKSYSFTICYSKRVNLSRQWALTGGLQGGWGLNQLDWDKLNFADQLDFEYGFVLPTQVQKPGYTSKQIWDVNAGIILEYKNQLALGITGHHLTKPENGYIPADKSNLNRKYSAHISYEIPLKGSNLNMRDQYRPSISPSVLYQRQGIFNNILGGFYIDWYPVVGGLWFRHVIFNSDAIILVVGFEQERYKIHYSFDYTISKLTFPSSVGAHEISFTWLFACPDYMKKRIRQVKCPSFTK